MSSKIHHLVPLSRLLSCGVIAVGGVLFATGCGGGGEDSGKKPDTTTQSAKEDGDSHTSASPSKKDKHEGKHQDKGITLKGNLKPATPGPAKRKGIPASASPYVGLLTQRLPASRARRAGGKAGGAGIWRISMGEAAYSIYGPTGTVASGLLKVAGNRMTFSPLPRRPKLPQPKGKKQSARAHGTAPVDSCAGKKGVYRFSVKGKRVRFTKVTESCAARAVIAGGSWLNTSPRSG